MAGFAFDPGDITLEELEILESHGVDFGLFQTVAETGEMPSGVGYAKLMRGLAYVVNCRQDVAYTWAQTGKLSLSDITELLEGVGELVSADPIVPHAV